MYEYTSTSTRTQKKSVLYLYTGSAVPYLCTYNIRVVYNVRYGTTVQSITGSATRHTKYMVNGTGSINKENQPPPTSFQVPVSTTCHRSSISPYVNTWCQIYKFPYDRIFCVFGCIDLKRQFSAIFHRATSSRKKYQKSSNFAHGTQHD